MIVENTVEAAVDSIIDVVHEAPFALVIADLTDGMNLGEERERGRRVKATRLCNYVHTTALREELIQ